jgi:hypothetical protein
MSGALQREQLSQSAYRLGIIRPVVTMLKRIKATGV